MIHFSRSSSSLLSGLLLPVTETTRTVAATPLTFIGHLLYITVIGRLLYITVIELLLSSLVSESLLRSLPAAPLTITESLFNHPQTVISFSPSVTLLFSHPLSERYPLLYCTP